MPRLHELFFVIAVEKKQVMDPDSLIEEVLIQLRIVSQLREGKHNKLSFEGPDVRLQKQHRWSFIWRAWNGDSRRKTVNFIQKLLEQTQCLVKYLGENRYCMPLPDGDVEAYAHERHQSIIHNIKLLRVELQGAIDGILILAHEYSDSEDVAQRLHLQSQKAARLIVIMDEKIPIP